MSQSISYNTARPSTLGSEIIQSMHVLRRDFLQANIGGDNVQRPHSNIRVVEDELTTKLGCFAPRCMWPLSCIDFYVCFLRLVAKGIRDL